MKQLKAAIVCIAVLYCIDAFWLNGWYFSTARQVIAQAWTINW